MGSPHLFLGEKVRTQSSCLETSENLRKSPRTVETFENLRLWIRTLKTVESPAGRVSECYKHFGPLTKSIYKSCILINPISQSVSSVQFSCSLNKVGGGPPVESQTRSINQAVVHSIRLGRPTARIANPISQQIVHSIRPSGRANWLVLRPMSLIFSENKESKRNT